MSAAVPVSARSTAPNYRVPRSIRLVRVGVLLVAGVVIAFSATLHEQLSFDTGVATAALGAIGIAHVVEWLATQKASRTPIPLLLGIVSIAAALVLPFTDSVIAFAIVIAAWSLASALLEFVGATVRPGSRQDATLLGAAGVLLALFVLLVREDQVAILGFFGAYAVLAGVFLGISAFDTRSDTGAPVDVAGSAPAAQ